MGRRMQRTRDEFPDAIRTQMRKHGYTKESLAKEIGVTTSAVGNWLRGGNINKPNLAKIEKILNLKMVYYKPITPKDAEAIIPMLNEQVSMLFDDEDDETEEAQPKKMWLDVYKTPTEGVFKANDDAHTYIFVKQKFSQKMDNVPFVMLVLDREAEDE